MSKVLGILGQIEELSAQDLRILRQAILDRFGNPGQADGDREVKEPVAPTLTDADVIDGYEDLPPNGMILKR